jgi:hypothetical protein
MIAILQRFTRLPAVSAALAVALLLAGCAAPLPERIDVVHGEGLLWRIDKQGYEPSYLYGTIHISDVKVRALTPAAEEAFLRARHAAFELSDEEEPEEGPVFPPSAVLLPAGQSLEQLLDAETYERLIEIADSREPSRVRLGELHISRFKPWFVMMTVAGKPTEGAGNPNPLAPSLDDWLEERARETGKGVTSLETLEEQIDVFNGMPLEDQAALLKDRLDDYDYHIDYYTYRQLYLDGDTAMFYAIWQRTLGRLEPGLAARYAERFLDGRNVLMVERMRPLLAEGSTFVAVGALHLPGEGGLLALLEREGYTVTRLY